MSAAADLGITWNKETKSWTKPKKNKGGKTGFDPFDY